MAAHHAHRDAWLTGLVQVYLLRGERQGRVQIVTLKAHPYGKAHQPAY
jgi:hypothetical protein